MGFLITTKKHDHFWITHIRFLIRETALTVVFIFQVVLEDRGTNREIGTEKEF